MTSESSVLKAKAPTEYGKHIYRIINRQGFAETFRLQNLYCDFVIKAGNKRYNCHKLVLAATVPYFETMLSPSFLETSKGEIEFPEHMSDSLDIVIKYIYTGSIEISVSNVLNVHRVVSYLGLKDLVNDCNDFVNKNIDLISETDGFLSLECSELLRMIKCDHQQANEQFIWETVMKWVKHDPKSRLRTLPELMEEVRFDLINPTYLWQNIAKDDLLTSSSQCKDIIYDVLGNRLTELDLDGMNPSRNRCVVGDIYVLGGGCNGSATDRVLTFDSQTAKWVQIESMNEPLSEFGAAVLERNIFIVGGWFEETQDGLQMFDTVNKKWSQLSDLNEGRYGLGVCSVSNSIYACGGRKSYPDSLNTVERYDSGVDCWVTTTPMNETRGYVNVVYTEGSIWAIGGTVMNNKILKSVERFDPREGRWSQCTPMLEEREDHAATVLDNKIYVRGGNSLQEYDPRNTKWRYLPSMLHSRSKPSLVTYGVMIWAIAGKNETVEIYDVRKNEWTLGTPLPWSVTEHSAVVVPHSIH